MKFVEKSGRTIDNAITDALIELGATTDEVEIEVIEKGSKGILGFGVKDAKVKVTIKQKTDISIQDVMLDPQIDSLPVEDSHKVNNIQQKDKSSNSEDYVIIAKQFLEKVLKEMNIQATIEAKISEDNRIHINISGNNMGMIIGKRGETLDALQYLTNIAINKERENYIKVMIDTENYRARREETLTKLAYKLAKKAAQTKRPVILEPMNPYDRRIIHASLQNSKTVKTHSEGKEPFRRIVITPYYQSKSYK